MEAKELKARLAHVIGHTRDTLGLTLRQLEEGTGLKLNALYQMENKRSLTLENIGALATFYGYAELVEFMADAQVKDLVVRHPSRAITMVEAKRAEDESQGDA